jgi:hypothetical protein
MPPSTAMIKPSTIGRVNFSRQISQDSSATQMGPVVTSTTDEVTVV